MALTPSASVTPAPRQSLGGRLVLATLVFCLAFTVAAVGVRTWSAWQENIDRLSGELKLMGQIYQRTLSKSVWDMDRDAMAAQIASAANIESIGRIEVKLTSMNRPPEIKQSEREGWRPSEALPALNIPLYVEPFVGAPREIVGELTLHGDERVLWVRLKSEIVAIIVTQVVQSLLLASLVMLMFNRLVTVHVRKIAEHLGNLTPATLGLSLALDRRAAHRDELAQLVDGVNALQGNLTSYLQQQQRYEQELVAHRDNLKQLVKDRTQELEAANARLESLACTDTLTGLSNRRQLENVKEAEYHRARRSGQPLSLLVCDIDHFKKFNDTYGHAAGDQCLQAVARCLQSVCNRASDLVARIGGEEFALLLPGTSATQAARIAERILQAVAEMAIEHKASETAPYVTISVGIAELGVSTPSFDTLFDMADKALYQAKAAGRNQAIICQTTH
jgi:diguanylate cyclase (GGDEF)-like protein